MYCAFNVFAIFHPLDIQRKQKKQKRNEREKVDIACKASESIESNRRGRIEKRKKKQSCSYENNLMMAEYKLKQIIW